MKNNKWSIHFDKLTLKQIHPKVITGMPFVILTCWTGSGFVSGLVWGTSGARSFCVFIALWEVMAVQVYSGAECQCDWFYSSRLACSLNNSWTSFAGWKCSHTH